MNKTILKTNQNAYFIKFSINAHCEAEELLGFPITQINEKNAGLLTFRTLLFVGMKYGGNPVSMEQAGEVIEEVVQDKGMDYFSKQMGEAIKNSLNNQESNNFKQQQNN